MAGRVVDSLSVLLTMNTRAFDRAMSGVSKTLSSFKTQLYTLAGVAGIGATIKSAVSLADNLQNLSNRLGIPASQLNQLRKVSELSGVGLDTLARGMAKVSIQLGGNSKEFAAAIDALGLSQQKLMAMTQAERVVALADGFAKITDETKALVLASAIWGERLGPQMLQVMKEIGDQSQETKDRLSSLFGGMTDEQIKALDNLGDAWTALWDAVVNSAGAALASISGPLTDAMKWATDKIVRLSEIMDGVWSRVRSFGIGVGRTAQSFMGGTAPDDAVRLRSEAGMWFSNAFAGSGMLATFEGVESNTETSATLLRQIEQNTRVFQINGVQLQ